MNLLNYYSFMARGGARLNTGPKKGSKHKKTIEKAREDEVQFKLLREKVIAKDGPMTDALIKEVVEKGNVAAYKELHDRAFGKVKESLEVDNKGEITFKIVKYGDNDSLRLPASQISRSDT